MRGCELLHCLLQGKAGLWPLGKPAVLSAGPESALRSTVSWLQRGHRGVGRLPASAGTVGACA